MLARRSTEFAPSIVLRLRGQATLIVSAVVLLAAWLSAVFPWVWIALGQGRWTLVLLLLLGLAFVAVSLRSLMPATLVLVVLTAEALGIFGDQGGGDLPFVQVMAGVRVTIRDVLLVALLPFAVARLVRRNEVPIFTRPLLAVLAAIGVAFGLGIVMDGDVKTPLNSLRPLFGYVLYVIVVAAVDSHRKLIWFLGTIFGVSLLAVGIQVDEAIVGQPLPFLALPLAAAQALAGLSVDGRQVPYIWNHAPWHLFLTLFLALGGLLEWRGVLAHAGIALACAVGFAIMLIRSWYIFILVGLVVMLVVQPSWTRRLRFLGVLGLCALAIGGLASAAAELTSHSYGGSLVDVWLGRTSTLVNFQQDSSYQARVQELVQQWQAVLASPLLGYGLSATAQRLTVGLGNLDTGAVNTLVMFGALGTAVFVTLVLYAAWTALRLVRRLPPSWERGYALGLVGVWLGVLVGYTFNYDFLTYPNGPWLVVLALAVQDRLERLARYTDTRVYSAENQRVLRPTYGLAAVARAYDVVRPRAGWRDKLADRYAERI